MEGGTYEPGMEPGYGPSAGYIFWYALPYVGGEGSGRRGGEAIVDVESGIQHNQTADRIWDNRRRP